MIDCRQLFLIAGEPMLQVFFLWFYCLSITDVLLLIFVVSVVYCVLRQWLCKKRFWRPVIALFLLAWLMVIAAATLTNRVSSNSYVRPELIPFHSYRSVMSGENREILRSNFMNVLLFYPAGLFFCELLPQNWSQRKKIIFIAVLFALASSGIEFCQYHYRIGQAEVDDVIHNTLGTFIGVMVSAMQVKVSRKHASYW